MGLYICEFIPKKSAPANGTVALAIAVDAKNKKLADMKASVELKESFPDSVNNYFKPKISLHRNGVEHHLLMNSMKNGCQITHGMKKINVLI